MLELKRGCPLTAVVAGVVEANRLVNSTINHWIEWEVICGDAPIPELWSKMVAVVVVIKEERSLTTGMISRQAVSKWEPNPCTPELDLS
jgi:hypothetical protein